MQCQFCAALLSSKSALGRHQRESRKCLVAQGKLSVEDAARKVALRKEPSVCSGCNRSFSRAGWLREHVTTCYAANALMSTREAHTAERQAHLSATEKLRAELKASQQALKELQASTSIASEQRYLQGKLDATKEINDNLIGLDLAQSRVKALEKKYLRKQPRDLYPDLNVVYIITNPDLQARGTYILGSATNLTNRLSTYNKSAEHLVIYYAKCRSKENMRALELFILQKLSSYREQANRDRFKLPDDKDVNFFVDALKELERLLP